MSCRRVVIVGVGKRVREAVLPAFRALEDLYEVSSLHGRSARDVQAANRSWQVEPLTELTTLEDVDLLYLAVGKNAVPEVLARLASMDVSTTDLLIDTPVVRFKHFRHLDKLVGYREVWVPEDCAYLPWIPPLRRAAEAGALGRVERALLWRSGYAYHGLATVKAMLGAERVTGGRRARRPDGLFERRLRLTDSGRALVVEPRDYAQGHISLEGSERMATDRVDAPAGSLPIELVLDGDRCRSVRVGDELEALDDAEASLTVGSSSGDTATARQEAMKRVGLARLLRDVHAGRGAYPLADAVDDMVIDYHLEKLGRYWSNPLTDPRFSLARAALKAVSRLSR